MIMVVVLECRASSGPGDVVVTPREAPAHYGSREAPVVSRLGTTLAARRSLEGDLKVVLSFPGFGGERAWNGFGQAMWLGRVLLSRASWPIRSSLDSSLRLRLSSTRRLSPTRRQHSGRDRRSRLPPKLESTARPARLRRRGPVVPVRGGGRRRSGPAPPCRLSRKRSGGQTHH